MDRVCRGVHDQGSVFSGHPLKGVSVMWPISQADLHLIYSYSVCKMISSFVDISLYLNFICYQVYVSLYRGRCLNMVPWQSQELYSAK